MSKVNTNKMTPRTLERFRMGEREKILARKAKRDSKAEARRKQADAERQELINRLKPPLMRRPICYDSQRDFPLGGGWLTPTELILQLVFIFGFLGLMVWIFYFPIIARVFDVETLLQNL